jgi:hypothetical protein
VPAKELWNQVQGLAIPRSHPAPPDSAPLPAFPSRGSRRLLNRDGVDMPPATRLEAGQALAVEEKTASF